jgi:hypothetical protein
MSCFSCLSILLPFSCTGSSSATGGLPSLHIKDGQPVNAQGEAKFWKAFDAEYAFETKADYGDCEEDLVVYVSLHFLCTSSRFCPHFPLTLFLFHIYEV